MICYASWALFVYNIPKLLTFTRLSTGNHRWVINAQTGPIFLAHPVYSWPPRT